MGKQTGRTGATHRVYLSVDREGALQAYREDYAQKHGCELPPVNSILLDLLVPFLEKEGYLLPGKLKGPLVRNPREKASDDTADRRK